MVRDLVGDRVVRERTFEGEAARARAAHSVARAIEASVVDDSDDSDESQESTGGRFLEFHAPSVEGGRVFVDREAIQAVAELNGEKTMIQLSGGSAVLVRGHVARDLSRAFDR